MVHLMTCVWHHLRIVYRVLSKNETAVHRVKLDNDCGFVVKRTHTQPAVVRLSDKLLLSVKEMQRSRMISKI